MIELDNIYNMDCHFNSTLVRLYHYQPCPRLYDLFDFNSTLVRLYLKPVQTALFLLFWFQFYISTIISAVKLAVLAVLSNFNSTLVRLYLGTNKNFPPLIAFQFYISTIISCLAVAVEHSLRFQFYISTIISYLEPTHHPYLQISILH